MNASLNARDLPSSTDLRDYRRGTLLGSIIVLTGILFGVVSIFVLTSSGSKLGMVPIFFAITVPSSFVLTGLLIIGRAKLALWLMYLLAADFVYSFLLRVAHALKTKGRDDVYGALLDLIWVGFWLSIVMYFHHRRKMFTGFWGSLNERGTRSKVER